MTATATLNVRIPEDLKDHGMQVLSRQHISVSDAVRQLFSELERSQRVPDFIAEARGETAAQEKRELLRAMTASRRKPQDLEPPIEPHGHDWREDWHAHLLEKYDG